MRAADRKLQQRWLDVMNDCFYLSGSLPFRRKKFYRFARLVARSLSVSFPEIGNSNLQLIVQSFLARCPMPLLSVPQPNSTERWVVRILSDLRIRDALAEYRRIAPIEFGGSGRQS